MVLETLPPLPPPAPSLMRPKEEESIVPHQPVLLPAIKLNRTHSLPQNLKMILIPSTTALNQPKSSTITLQNQTHYSIYTIAPEETSSLPTPSSFLLDGWTEKEEETAQVSQILRRPIDKVDANGKTAENDQRADGAGADEFGGDSEAEDEEEGTKYQSDERGKDEQCLPAIHASSRRKEEEDAEETTAVRSEQAGSSFDATDSTLHATAAPAHATTQRTATGDVADWTERDCVAPPATHIHILHHSAVDTSTICVSSLETNITLAKSECWERSRPIPNHVTPPLPHQHSIHARSPSLLHLPPLSRVNTRHPSDIQPDSLSSRNSCNTTDKLTSTRSPRNHVHFLRIAARVIETLSSSNLRSLVFIGDEERGWRDTQRMRMSPAPLVRTEEVIPGTSRDMYWALSMDRISITSFNLNPVERTREQERRFVVSQVLARIGRTGKQRGRRGRLRRVMGPSRADH
ncbi:hypothetical protein BLNAU_4788 [Blattamonas nauphoetae]|uniref:Uncharacterized protein n=1 Tax=Blattamonas nauphoetae TaxID=2049346 RepID=A0ABQ9Y908_9EUKA|nr:hypothetical protein BLNAU_21285 [Blattamonas nauphoetae]KAK2946175.1 hypothetical protein BLNAU_18919 [Blattamonas nauphoetae]KAK2960235.1 hypothetical protein BLNAU_4788 [Blattamonas nauphoetae]